jgi:hypothetical protein
MRHCFTVLEVTDMFTSTMPAEARPHVRSRSLSAALALGAVLATLGSLGFISLNSLPPREAYAHPVSVVTCAMATIGCLILSFALLRWRSTLPGWAVVASAAGLFFAAASAYAQGTFTVAAATKTDNELFDELFFGSPWVLGGMLPKSLLCLAGFLALAIVGWRRRSIPRAAAALLGFAGILSIWPPYPPGVIAAAIAIVLIARRPIEARR